MVSNRLSRWTPLFFLFALVNFLAAQGLILAGYTWPAQAISAPGTLVAVHLLTVGCLMLLMFGALLQFVPVITSSPLVSQRLALVALMAIQGGLIGMICGFLGIAGGPAGHGLALPVGGGAVLGGVLIVGWNIGVPLVRAKSPSLPGRMVLTGLAFLLLTVALGLSFALALTLPALTPRLGPLLGGVGSHALAGLGGWLTLTAMGVSYKLLPMFMLAPEERGAAGDCVHLLGTAGFALAVAIGLVQIWIPLRPLRIAETAGHVAVVLAIMVYLWDVVRIYRTRKRAAIEAHNRSAVAAFGFLGLATALALGSLAKGTLAEESPLLVFLVVFGWLGGLGLTQLYKIVPFLAWLSRYGSSLGRGAVPRVQDLVNESRGSPWLATYFLGVLLAAISAFFGMPSLFRLFLTISALATCGLAVEYWRAWRGYYVRLRGNSPATPQFLPNQRG